VSAIYEEDDLPEKWEHYVQINRDWFAHDSAGTVQSRLSGERGGLICAKGRPLPEYA
jgi:hypothetical protein